MRQYQFQLSFINVTKTVKIALHTTEHKVKEIVYSVKMGINLTLMLVLPVAKEIISSLSMRNVMI